MNTESDRIARVIGLIDCMLRANKEAGLQIDSVHLHAVRLILCPKSVNVETPSTPLDTNLATEPASCVAKRLLKM